MYKVKNSVVTMKRKFVSHVPTEKNNGVKKKNGVEAVIASCYVNTMKEMIESEAFQQCNRCICSYNEKVELYFQPVFMKLMDNNDEVIKQFEECIAINKDDYDIHDVLNARNMLRCKSHREFFCINNRRYFNEMLQK